jgi:creatinine amidohydrolase
MTNSNKINPWVLNHTSWKSVKEVQFEMAVLPWGATEPHNLHLPYGTDNLQAEAIALKAAEIAWKKGCKVMVLPTIPLGVQNSGQMDLPFCLHTKPSTQLAILQDILWALNRQNISRLVILNSHGGNDFRSMIRELQPQFPNMFIGVIDWFKIPECNDFFETPGDHAGEMETSIMQYCFPDLVLPLNEAGTGNAKGFSLEGLQSKLAWTPRNWTKITEDTGVGNPSAANSEKGELFFNYLTERIGEFLVELSAVKTDDIYK